jgi:hypothetical protein
MFDLKLNIINPWGKYQNPDGYGWLSGNGINQFNQMLVDDGSGFRSQ